MNSVLLVCFFSLKKKVSFILKYSEIRGTKLSTCRDVSRVSFLVLFFTFFTFFFWPLKFRKRPVSATLLKIKKKKNYSSHRQGYSNHLRTRVRLELC